jgi:phenylalanyl-tRNA synthetase beta chain
MFVPVKWLREFVDFTYSPEELAERLTMAGLEIEGIERPFSYLQKVIVAQIEAIKPHPNADRLKICVVSVGKDKKYEIICGAPNVKEGIRVPLALPGCKLPSGLEVKETKIRGIKSLGMLCSQKELGLGEDHSGIWVLPEDLEIGLNLDEALGLEDTVLEVSITPNRGDCLSILGVAREIAALTRQEIRYPEVNIEETGLPVEEEFKVTIEHPDHCYRYVGRLIRDIKLGPSPWWMQARLLLAGIRPINNIVDITNYVMLECGQPLHAFDAERIAEKHIIVRLANEGERLTTLDGKEHVLTSLDLLICDPKGPIALAGIMGGLNSEIFSKTKHVFLESAYFNPITIRKTAKRLGISTESSYRFEREVDPEGTLFAAQRASYLMQLLAAGKVASGIIDVYPKPYQPKHVFLRIPRVKQILGMEIKREEVIDILKGLQIEVKEGDKALELVPPSYRHDLEREIDFIEEIARLHGYANIPSAYPVIPLKAKPIPFAQKMRERIKEIMVGLGWSEIITYAFIDPKSFDKLRLPQEHLLRKVTKLLNPLTSERAVMRSTLIPSLLEACDYNMRQQISHLRLFELNKVFLQVKENDLPEERYKLGGVLSGHHYDFSWHFQPPQKADFYDLKGTIEALFKAMGIEGVKFVFQEDIPYLHPARSAYVVKEDKIIGYLGEIHPEVKEAWDLRHTAFVFELDIDTLLSCISAQRQFKPLPKFPFTSRDAAFIVPLDFVAQEIEDFVYSLKVDQLEEVTIIDVYQGKGIPEDTKSLTYRFVYRASDRTLTDEEVEKIHEKIVDKILKQFQITVR